MQEVLLLKCGELVLKGLNRSRFESRLLKNLSARLAPLGEFSFTSLQSTITVVPKGEVDMDAVTAACREVFGIVTVYRAVMAEKDMEAIKAAASEYFRDQLARAQTFRVLGKRADKSFPLTSPQIGAELGGHLMSQHPHLKGKMDDPDLVVRVEIRDHHAFICGHGQPGAGGMPAGTAGRAMLLLSGGIDSPVAGHMMAKRGLELSAVHFFSYPYTSRQATEKVLSLAEILSGYTGNITVSLVPFTRPMQEMAEKCEEDYFTLIMRRMMMRIAERTAIHQGCGALITGESLGQVASQTMEALLVTGEVCSLPVFRPVIGMDKEEIVVRARNIGTFETSILPYEDCCTVFTPKHPKTKPRLEQVLEQEAKLDTAALEDEAFENIERVTLPRRK